MISTSSIERHDTDILILGTGGAGMFAALAAATALRSRGFPSTSPPPRRAEIVISLMTRVNTLPRLASAAAFLCLIVLHLFDDNSSLQPDRSSQMHRN